VNDPFNGERSNGPAVEEWDGRPRAWFSREQLGSLYDLVPQWKGRAVGPPIPFGDGRAVVSVSYIFRSDREGALEAMEFQVRRACHEERMEFDPEQWTVEVEPHNAS
jgi:hypothetical protein